MGFVIKSIGTFSNRNGSVKSSLELIKKASLKCLDKPEINKEEIDLVINASLYRDNYFAEPAFATFVQNELDINLGKAAFTGSRTFAFDLTNGALGFMNCCQTIGAMIASGKAKSGLVVSGDVIDFPVDYSGSKPDFMEVGTAMLIEKENGDIGFGPFHYEIFDDYHDAYKVYKFFEEVFTIRINKNPGLEEILLKCIPTSMENYLFKTDMSLEDFRYIVPPQISTSFIKKLSDSLGIELDRFIDITWDNKDLFNACIPMALQYIIDKKLVQSGDRALIINAGSGIQVGCTVYNF